MKTKTINQNITFNASASAIYELLMDEKKHSQFTGSSVSMSKKKNGKFEVFDGYCTGYNIELVEGKKIIQAWHFEEDGWPEDHYSICTILLDETIGKTKLLFKQEHVPEHKVESLKKGWKEFYWQPMKNLIKKQ